MWVPLILAIGGGIFFTNKKVQAKISDMFGPFVPPSGLPYKEIDLDTMARTMWGEARSEGNVGMHAVANVIMNRYRMALNSSGYAKMWGNTPAGICTKPYQFSCWLSNDPNYKKLVAVSADKDPAFANALSLARQALQYKLPDITGGATYYHTKAIRPKWALNIEPISEIGSHKFYTATQVG